MRPSLKSQRGQMVTEAILILVVFMAVTFAIAQFFKDQELLKKLISGPWQNMAGMLQNGSWGTPEATAESHPNSHVRHISIQGVVAQ